MFIEVKNLTYIYGEGTPYKKVAVDNVSLEMEKATFNAIIGHTGSGKSTLIQTLNGLLKPASGEIYIDGMDVAKKNLKEIRNTVGMVFQYPEHQLFEETVYKDIAYGLKKQGKSEKQIDEAVHRAIRLLELDEKYLERSPFELSGGQKRKVALAGVIAMEPKVLVLDEPAAGMDPGAKRNLLGLLLNLKKEMGLTVIMVSHSMEDIAQLADKVFVMNDGKIELEGTPREVFAHGDRLKEIGLMVPEITAFMMRLAKQTGRFDGVYLTVQEAKDAIMKEIANAKFD